MLFNMSGENTSTTAPLLSHSLAALAAFNIPDAAASLGQRVSWVDIEDYHEVFGNEQDNDTQDFRTELHALIPDADDDADDDTDDDADEEEEQPPQLIRWIRNQEAGDQEAGHQEASDQEAGDKHPPPLNWSDRVFADRLVSALHTRTVITIHGIKSIDNVKTVVRIYKKPNRAILIQLTYAYTAAFKQLKTFWIYAEYEEISQTVTSIGTLKYSRIGQLFKYPENLHKQSIDDDVACMIASSATSPVQLAWDICCVCHEHTDCETICGHNLCLQCHSQMIAFENDKCPMCRRILPYE